MGAWAVLYDEAFALAGRTSPFLIFHQGVAPLCPGLCAHCPFRAYILSIRRIRTCETYILKVYWHWFAINKYAFGWVNDVGVLQCCLKTRDVGLMIGLFSYSWGGHWVYGVTQPYLRVGRTKSYRHKNQILSAEEPNLPTRRFGCVFALCYV